MSDNEAVDAWRRLAGAVIAAAIARDDRYVYSAGFETWCRLTGADPAAMRQGIRLVQAKRVWAGGDTRRGGGADRD